MRKRMKCFLIFILMAVCFSLGIFFKQINRKNKLDSHYLSCLKTVKDRLAYGSSVDTKKELEDYEDQIELYMHLDGYDAVEILSMKVEALCSQNQYKK